MREVTFNLILCDEGISQLVISCTLFIVHWVPGINLRLSMPVNSWGRHQNSEGRTYSVSHVTDEEAESQMCSLLNPVSFT